MDLPENYEERIKDYECLRNINYFFEPEEAFNKLINVKGSVPDDLYGFHLRMAFQVSTYGLSKETILEAFRDIPKKCFMDSEEIAYYDQLDQNVTIYRGISLSSVNQEPRFSWTFDKTVAEKYGNYAVLEAEIKKEQIIAIFRSNTFENEVVADVYENQILNLAILD